MPITDTWTTPSTLDRAIGQILTEAIWDNAVSNELYLWSTLHNFVRAASVLSVNIGNADTNLTRAGVGILKANGDLYAGGDVLANQAQTEQILLTQISSQAGIYFSNANDTSIRRVSAGVLETAGEWRTLGPLVPSGTATGNLVPVRLGEQVLPAGAAAITIGSILPTFRNLRIEFALRGNTAANQVGALLRFNGDTGTNYHYQLIRGDGGTASAARSLSQTSFGLFQTFAANATANWFGGGAVTVLNYKATDKTKAVVCQAFAANSAGLEAAETTAGHWASTAAITQVDVLLATGNLSTGSTVTLLGIP